MIKRYLYITGAYLERSLRCDRTLAAREATSVPFEIYKRGSSHDQSFLSLWFTIFDGWQEEKERRRTWSDFEASRLWNRKWMDGCPITRERSRVPLRDGATRVRRHERGRPTPNQIAQFREFRKVVPRIHAPDLRQRPGDVSLLPPLTFLLSLLYYSPNFRRKNFTISNFKFLFFSQNDRSNRKRHCPPLLYYSPSLHRVSSKEFYDIEFWISFFFSSRSNWKRSKQ